MTIGNGKKSSMGEGRVWDAENQLNDQNLNEFQDGVFF